MIHKTIPARRHERRVHIARKRNIERHIMRLSESYLASEPSGYLNKNKIHCSCPLCSAKSTKNKGVNTNSKNSYKVSDRRKFETMYADMKDYNLLS